MADKASKHEYKKLSLLKHGQKGIVAELDTDDASILRKLMSMGILPGVEIEMMQRFPSYVFKVGYTHVAIDKEIAGAILVSI